MPHNKRNYRDNFEEIYLRYDQQKAAGNDVPTERLETYRYLSKIWSKKVFSSASNRKMFFRAGMELEDVESIAMSYIYLFLKNYTFVHDSKDEKGLLNHFLKHQLLILIDVTKRKVNGVAESCDSGDDATLTDLTTPQSIYETIETSTTIKDKLSVFVSYASNCIESIYDRHAEDFKSSAVAKDDLMSISCALAVSYIAKNDIDSLQDIRDLRSPKGDKKFYFYIFKKVKKLAKMAKDNDPTLNGLVLDMKSHGINVNNLLDEAYV